MGKGKKAHKGLALSQSSNKSTSVSARVVERAAIMEQYSGPIPSATEFKKYEEILPGAADRILGMAERQATHRQKLETSAIESNIGNSRRGQFFAFVISMTALVAGFILILCDKNALGISIIIADLVTLAAVFTGNRISESRELSRKRNDSLDNSKELSSSENGR